MTVTTLNANDTKFYIDGAWVASTGKGTLEVINSTTEEVMGTIPEGTMTPEQIQALGPAFAAYLNGFLFCCAYTQTFDLLTLYCRGLLSDQRGIEQIIQRGLPDLERIEPGRRGKMKFRARRGFAVRTRR